MSSHFSFLKRVHYGHPDKKIFADPHLLYRLVLRTGLAVFITFFLLILAALLSAMPARAIQPVVLTDTELSGVTGQAGISIYKSIAMRYSASVIKFSDTDSTPRQWLELRNVTVDDGSGGPFLIETPFMEVTETIDVGTNDAGRTLVSHYDASHVSPRWYSVGDVVFCNQSLGSINLDALTMGPSVYRIGAHVDGTGGGYDFDYTTRLYAQAFRYTDKASQTLNLSGIHLVGSATGAADNPADPTTWQFAGANNVFRIGNIDSGNPAKVDVVTDTSTGETSLYLNLPMEGSLRVENVTFGGNNFGPIAIDGINVHRLTLQIR